MNTKYEDNDRLCATLEADKAVQALGKGEYDLQPLAE